MRRGFTPFFLNHFTKEDACTQVLETNLITISKVHKTKVAGLGYDFLLSNELGNLGQVLEEWKIFTCAMLGLMLGSSFPNRDIPIVCGSYPVFLSAPKDLPLDQWSSSQLNSLMLLSIIIPDEQFLGWYQKCVGRAEMQSNRTASRRWVWWVMELHARNEMPWLTGETNLSISIVSCDVRCMVKPTEYCLMGGALIPL